MERRKFVRSLGMGSLLLPFPVWPSMATPRLEKEMQIPEALKVGDTIGIISPASAIFESEPYQIAKETFEALGLTVRFGTFTKSRYGHLAGTDRERAMELMQMFEDPEIRGIVALRGGSGAARLLDLLDYELISRNPKVFLGYSDITALHLAFYTKCRLVTYHGPVAVSTWNSFTTQYVKDLLFEKESVQYKNPTDKGDQLAQTAHRIRTIHGGKATGELLGGNLSVLTSLMGTPYFPQDWKGKILYLEDVGEKIYAVDRMLSQLHLGGVLQHLNGFVFGKCTGCDPGGNGFGSLTLEEVVDHYIRPLGIPAFSGAMIGHIDHNSTIPNGILAEINAEIGTISLQTPAVK